MRVLNIPYLTWKEVVQTHDHTVYYLVEATNSVSVWAGNPEFLFCSKVDPDDYADFQANFESEGTSVESEDDATARVVGMGADLQPRAADGRPITLSVRYRGDVTPFFAGSSDGPGGRGEGPIFLIRWNNPPAVDEIKEEVFSFKDWVYLAKGHIHWINADSGDYAGIDLEAPATTVVANPGAGNCNLVPTGAGFNAIVPAAGDGSHDYSDPVPVPAFGPKGRPNGHWTWSEPDTGKGDVAFVGDGKSPYNLYDAKIVLTHWIKKLPLIGDGMQVLHPEGKAKKILPQWEFRVTVKNKSLSALKVTWNLDGARKVTV